MRLRCDRRRQQWTRSDCIQRAAQIVDEVGELAGIGRVKRFPIQINAIVSPRGYEIHEVGDEAGPVHRAGGALKAGGAVLSADGNQHLDARDMRTRDDVRGILLT